MQDGRVLAHGIIIASTAGHGGVRISPARLKQMPAALRLGRRRWFEEDCEAALVGLAFADDLEFTDSRRDDLAAVVAKLVPDELGGVLRSHARAGRVVPAGQGNLRSGHGRPVRRRQCVGGLARGRPGRTGRSDRTPPQ
ncbi:DUF7007 domain-containing protein [Rhodococcus sp. B50]|uniref:DUF7007 domain-containing protein n=1 Tax=Rhodococcus sp. B50 TaxID=2682847 RepID=UPI0035AC22EA